MALLSPLLLHAAAELSPAGVGLAIPSKLPRTRRGRNPSHLLKETAVDRYLLWPGIAWRALVQQCRNGRPTSDFAI